MTFKVVKSIYRTFKRYVVNTRGNPALLIKVALIVVALYGIVRSNRGPEVSSRITDWRLIALATRNPTAKSPIGFSWQLLVEDESTKEQRVLDLALGKFEVFGSGCEVFVDNPVSSSNGATTQAGVIVCNEFAVSAACNSIRETDPVVTQIQLPVRNKAVFMTLQCTDGFRANKTSSPFPNRAWSTF